MQSSFCKGLTLSVLALASVHQANAYSVINTFKETGKEKLTVRGAFNDMVVKRALHIFIKEHLPNFHFCNINKTSVDAHDAFNALADAFADIADQQLFDGGADYVGEVRLSLAGTFAHKLWEALLDVTGVAAHVGQEVRDNYDKFGKAWFSKAFGTCLNDAFNHALTHLRSQ